MKTTTLAVALITVIVSGCVSNEEIVQRHREACLSYGFTPGTDNFAACVQQEVSDARAASAPNPVAIQNGLDMMNGTGAWAPQVVGGNQAVLFLN